MPFDNSVYLFIDAVTLALMFYLFAIFRRRRRRKSLLSRARNGIRGNRNTSTNQHAGRDIKTVLPFDIDAQLDRMHQDKLWVREQLARRDEYILRMHQRQAAQPHGFPLLNLKDTDEQKTA